MIETISAIVIGVATIILTRILSRYFPVKLMAATILVAIAFIYVGYSLQDNPVSLTILEITVSLLFYFAALIGYMRNGYAIAYGIILHGVWDICHHNGFLVGTHIPGYWPSFCSVVDVIDGLYFLILFKSQKNSLVIHSVGSQAH
ncbi:MAG TPA: DUF6010 family protein [Chitinophagaceae bacterium]|jgi:hypothetical protein|nr:DUF6010 family protein [Chitinophagaceae bacterium]